jgi:hypothetical protein
MYAKLVVRTGTANTIAEMMQEMANVITGSVTTNSQLSVFDSVNSTITTTTPTNWSLIYPSVVTSNSNVYIFRSQCVNTSKYKYARLICKGTATNEPWVEPTGGTANPNQQRTYAARYVEMDSCTSANTTTAVVTNSTYKHQSNEGYIPFSQTLYISASARHLAMYSQYNSSTNIICAFGIFEHPETNITTGKNLIPVVTYRGRGAALTVTTTSLETAAAPGNSVMQVPDGYTSSTNTKSLLGIDALTSPHSFDFGQTFIASASDPGTRILSQANTYLRQFPGKDLFFYDINRSQNFINASSLSNVYYIPNGASTSSIGSLYTYGSNTYISLPLTSSTILFPNS